MGSPPRLCPLCANPGRFTVENCDECHRPHCKKHIRWEGGRWLCRRCAARIEAQARAQQEAGR